MEKKIMEIWRNFRFKKTYIRMFVSFGFAGMMLLTAVIFLIYTIFSQKMVEDIGNHSERLLQRDADNVAFLLDWTLSYAFRSSFDVNLQPYVQKDFEDTYLDYEVWTKLKSIRDNHPFIDSITLYNGYTKYFLDTKVGISSEKDYYDQGLVNFLNSRKITISHLLLPREAEIRINDEEVERHRWLTILIPFDYGVSPSMFVMNVNLDSLFSSISSKLANQLDELYLVREDGTIITGTDPDAFLRKIDTVYNSTSGDFPKTWTTRENDGQKEMIVYGDVKFSHIYDWKLIEKMPVRTLLEDIRSLRNTSLIVLFASLALIFLTVWWLSKKIYSPIEKLTRKVMSSTQGRKELLESDPADLQLLSNAFIRQNDQIQELSEYRRNNLELAKDAFLRRLIINSPAYSGRQLDSHLVEHHIRLSPTNLLIGVFRIDYYVEFVEKYTPSDQALLRFGISNIVKESLNMHTCETVDMEEDHVCFIINMDLSQAKLREKLLAIQQVVHQYLGLSTTIAAGRPFDHFNGLNHAYKEAFQLSEERFKEGQFFCFMPTGVQAGAVSEDYVFPEDMERALLSAVRQSQEDEAIKALNRFMDRVRRFPFMEARLAVTHLIFNLSKTLVVMAKSSHEQVDWSLSVIEEQLNELETMESIKIWLIERINISLASKREYPESDDKHHDVIRAICDKIEEKYADPNLSTKLLSDYVGLSTNYIRTLFKSSTQVSILDYISDKRLEVASRLLRTTDLSVEEIAEQTGFIALSSFYSGFKKRYYLTPNQYRRDIET